VAGITKKVVYRRRAFALVRWSVRSPLRLLWVEVHVALKPSHDRRTSTTYIRNDDETDNRAGWGGEDVSRCRPERSPWAVEYLACGARVSSSLYVVSLYADVSCSSVIWKLMSFTFAMITLPIGTYFFTVNYVFGGMLHDMLHWQRYD
jgi:hypothetical protein